jgi:myo-inositol 2-dehydrogenase/D-chiro-inositol 1-dehydrogenase
MLRAGNLVESTLEYSGGDGIVGEKPLHFFLERYAAAYRSELDHFIAAVAGKIAPPTSGADGLRALVLADASVESVKTGRAVAVKYTA